MKKLKEWEIFEEDVSDYLEGKRQPGSGNSCITSKKGDIKTDEYLVECKYTNKDAYKLSFKTWEKIVVEASNAFKTPLFACRSQAGDFFIGSTLDFDPEGSFEELEESSSVKVIKPFIMKLTDGNVHHQIVCWSVDL